MGSLRFKHHFFCGSLRAILDSSSGSDKLIQEEHQSLSVAQMMHDTLILDAVNEALQIVNSKV